MKRGDLLTVALQGDLGKPRPAMVIQSDLFSRHPSVTVLPVTSNLQAAPLFRIGIEPNEFNRLRQSSQVMVDKLQSVARARLGPVFGRVDDETLLAVNRQATAAARLTAFLGLRVAVLRARPDNTAASSSSSASAAYTASFCRLGTDEWQPVKPKSIVPA